MSQMHNLKSIRERLDVTQQVLADGLGCTQGNIAALERGQTLLPTLAAKLIVFAKTKHGLELTFDHIYGDAPLPEPIVAEPKAA